MGEVGLPPGRGIGVSSPFLSPTIYRRQGGGLGHSLGPSSKEGCGQGGVSSLPKAPRRCLAPLGLFLLLPSWRMGFLGLVPLAHIGQGAPPTAHVGPQGRWTPPGGPPDPIRHSRYNIDNN